MTPQETPRLTTSALGRAGRGDVGQGVIEGGTNDSVDSWTLTIQAPADWINLNQRHHWSTKAKLTKAWRSEAEHEAADNMLPMNLNRVHVTAYITKPTRRAFDVHNLIPTMKAVIDGLVDYGVVADDSTKYLTGPDMRVSDETGPASITIHIKEIQ